jgi:cobalt-zinc-cadmium efflux system outer membrane protein
VEQAGFAPNPSLSLSVENFGGNGRARGSDIMEFTIQASQLIERGGKVGHRVAFAERERDIAKASQTLRQSEILAAAANAYARAMAESTRSALADEQLKLAQETFASANRRHQAAVAAPSEVARTHAALASAQAESRRAQAAVKSALSAIAACWGGAAADIVELMGETRLPPAVPGLSGFESKLTSGDNPRLGLLSALAAGQRAALDVETARSVADVTVGAGVRRLNEGPATSFVLGASFPLSVRDDNSGNIRAARALVRSAEQLLRAAETEQRAALLAAHSELTAAHALATTLRKDALPAAVEACALTQSAYDKGVGSLQDVLDARRALIALRRDLLEAEHAYASALIRAEALVGVPFTETRMLFGQR